MDLAHQVSHVCIEHNSKVIVADFIPVVRKGFERHGITTEVYEGDKPRYCEFHCTYTALKAWDLGTYMHHAELQIYQGVKPIAYAQYHLNGKGGFALNKWASVDSKMNPVINRLLSGYSPEKVDSFRKPIQGELSLQETGTLSKSDKLRELKQWVDEGLITKQEYNTEKQKVLNQ